MSASKHTPPFYRVDKALIFSDHGCVGEISTLNLDSWEEVDDAADLIIRSVNSHDALRDLLLEAYEWFEEYIGHDGAPDGGDPGWVGGVRDLIGGEESSYAPDFDAILTSVLKKRAAERIILRSDLDMALNYLDCALSNDWDTSEGESADDAVRFYDDAITRVSVSRREASK